MAVGAKQPPEEEKGVFCQEEEDLALQHMLRIMGEQKGRPSPLSLKMMLLGEIDSTYLKYHKVLLKRHPLPSMTIQFTLSTPTMMGQVT
jgi:hypothetical protein